MDKETQACPECDKPIYIDYVDIGVGNMPMPLACQSCGWLQPSMEDEFGISFKTKEERDKGIQFADRKHSYELDEQAHKNAKEQSND